MIYVRYGGEYYCVSSEQHMLSVNASRSKVMVVNKEEEFNYNVRIKGACKVVSEIFV